jgi:hypothetical protein
MEMWILEGIEDEIKVIKIYLKVWNFLKFLDNKLKIFMWMIYI